MFTIDARQLRKLLPSRPQRLKAGALWKPSLWRSAWATLLVFLLSFQSVQMVAGNRSMAAPALPAYVEPLAASPTFASVDPTGTFTGSSRTLLLFQDGTRIFGDFTYSASVFTFEGTQSGNVVSGSLKYTNGTATSYTLTATYSADGTVLTESDSFGSGTLTKQSTVSVRLGTTRKVMQQGTSAAFQAYVAGAADKTVNWVTSGGTVDAAGNYMAPNQSGVFSLTAASVANPTASASATLMVTPDGLMEVSGSFTGTSHSLLFFQDGSRVFGDYTYGSTTYAFDGTQVGGTVSGKLYNANGTATSYTVSATYSADGTVMSVSDSWGLVTMAKQSTVSVRLATTRKVMKQGDVFGFQSWVAGSYNKAVTWSASGGAVSAAGSYTASATPGTYSVTASAAANPASTANATVMITPDGLTEVSGTFTGPSRALLFFQDGSRVFGDYTYGSSTYAFDGTQLGGTVSGKLYNTNGTATSYTVSATYSADGTVMSVSDSWGLVTMTKQPTVSVRLATNRKVMRQGDSFGFQAWVAGSYNKAVSWSATAGSVDAAGLYLASAQPGVYTVAATAAANGSASANATVMVTADGLMEVSGTYSGTSRTLQFFQDGTRVFGDYTYSSSAFTFDGTQVGGTVSGKLYYANGTATSYTVSATYSADGTTMSVSDSWGPGTLVKQALVGIRITPNQPQIVVPGAQVSYRGLVAGTYNKATTWSATAGNVVNGVYTVPTGFDDTAQTLTATAAADVSKQAFAQVSIAPMGVLNIEGIYKDNGNYQFTLYQNGTSLTGEWVYGSTKFAFQGTLAGYLLTGTLTPPNSTTHYNVSVTFAPDAKTFSGTNAYYGIWSGTRQGGAVAFTVTPTSATLRAGASQTFVPVATGMTNPAVSWTVVEANGGMITSSGVYTAPAVAGSYTVKATLVADPTKVVTIPITVRLPVVVSPLTLSLSAGTSTNFGAQLTGFTNTAVTWTATGGTITSTGQYTAPLDAGTYTITATSVETPSLSGSATVTVPFVMSVTPVGPVILGSGRTQPFTASVSGATNTSVTWEVVAPGLGSITPGGLYSAPQTLPDPISGATLQVKATSVARPSETRLVQVTLKSSILVSPQAPTVKPGEVQGFTSVLYGLTGSVIWSATGGSITSGGIWTAPDTAGTYTITAASAVDGSIIGTSTATVPVTLTWLEPVPSTMMLIAGLPWSMKAVVKGSTNKQVDWSFEGISESELMCPPEVTASYGSGDSTGSTSSSMTTFGVGTYHTPDIGIIGRCAPAAGRSFTLVARADADPNVVLRVTMQSMAIVAIWPTYVEVPAETSYTFKDVGSVSIASTRDMGTGTFVVEPISSRVTVDLSGGTYQWLDADKVQGVGGFVATTVPSTNSVSSSLSFGFPVSDDLRYTAPDTAGTYYMNLRPKANPNLPTTVTIKVPFTITLTDDLPPGLNLYPGQGAHFAAKVSGSPNKAVDWKVTYTTGGYLSTWTGGGSITQDGVFTSLPVMPDGIDYYTCAVEARSQADPSKAISKVFYVTRPAYFYYPQKTQRALTPQTFRLVGVAGGVTPLPNTNFTWSATGGQISADGTWIAPDQQGSYTITAVSKADPTVVVSTTVTVPLEIVLTPAYGFYVPLGGSRQVDAQVYGSPDKTLVWTLSQGGITGDVGTLSQSGFYQAPSIMPSQPGYFVIKAALASKPDVSASVSFQLTRALSVTPGDYVVYIGSTQTYYAYADGAATQAVTWSSSGGSITPLGVFTPPDLAGTYTITATSMSDPSITATATARVPMMVIINPSTYLTVRTGATQLFTARVKGAVDQTVIWRVVSGIGSIDADGTYHAPATVPATWNTVVITATSVADPTIYATFSFLVLPPVILQPSAVTVAAGAKYTFQTTLTGISGLFRWETTGGTMEQNGTYTAPAVAGTYTVTVTSEDEPSVSASSTVTVPISVKVSPQGTILPMGFTQGFFATVLGDPANQVAWSVAASAPGAPAGTINTFGAYTPPNTPGSYTVTATSLVDPTKKGSATIKVPQPLMITPERVTLKPTGTRKFTALGTTATGTPAVTWTATAGTVAADGTYTAPAEVGVYRVTATSTADPSVVATAEVDVTAQGAITIDLTPEMVQLKKGETISFSALVSGATNPALTWSTSGGTVEPDGHYTAPTQFGTFTVTAMSVEDPTVKAEATIVVVAQAGEDQSFTYDENGNLLSDGERTFEWDVENRLVAVTKGTHRSEFEYDPLGRRSRIIEKDADGQGGWTTGSDKRYLWEGAEIVEEETADGSTLKAFYGQGFVDTDGTALYYTGDHMGNIRELIDISGTVRARYDYDPYGRATKTSGDRDSVFLYAGYQYHPQSGLYLTLYRGYDPGLGRWISRDPIAEEAGTNVYAYVLGNPINFIDPYGLDGLGTVGSFLGRWGGRVVGGVVGEFIDPLGGGIPGEIIGGMVGDWVGQALGDWADKAIAGSTTLAERYLNRKPPQDACDPKGAKAPGKPGAAEGFKDPKSGETWGKAKNGKWGWVDDKGNVWVPTGPEGSPDAHGGPHWDVQKPGGYVNVYPGGKTR